MAHAFYFLLKTGPRALHFGSKPIPNAWLWSTVDLCRILSLWRKTGVEIQDFEYPGLGILCICKTNWVPSLQFWFQTHLKGLIILYSSGLSNSELLA